MRVAVLSDDARKGPSAPSTATSAEAIWPSLAPTAWRPWMTTATEPAIADDGGEHAGADGLSVCRESMRSLDDRWGELAL